MDGRAGKRATAQRAIHAYIAGKKPTTIAARAVDIARRRIAGDVHISKPMLPPEAGESGVPANAGPEDVRAHALRRVQDSSDLEFFGSRYDTRQDFGNIVSRDNAKELFYRSGAQTERTQLNEAVSDAAGVVAQHVYALAVAARGDSGQR